MDKICPSLHHGKKSSSPSFDSQIVRRLRQVCEGLLIGKPLTVDATISRPAFGARQFSHDIHINHGITELLRLPMTGQASAPMTTRHESPCTHGVRSSG